MVKPTVATLNLYEVGVVRGNIPLYAPNCRDGTVQVGLAQSQVA